MFDPQKDVCTIAKEPDGSFIVYARPDHHSLNRYFRKYRIIGKSLWDPAFHIGNEVLLDPNYNDHCTIAGAHNVVSLEDAFISGQYAANRALHRLKGT